MPETVLHKADTRGHANHGWLDSYHTFSFANYHNEERMHFGALRVLNDDTVAPGMGFGTHPHDNMEIISIPLEGDLEHKDSMGNTTVIRKGDVQVMSAGTGVRHSEYNKNSDKPVKFLQIWLFPNKQNVTPRYDQITLVKEDRHNKLQQVLSPDPRLNDPVGQADAGVWIHQDAWFFLADLDAGHQAQHIVKRNGNGVYIFVLSGIVMVGTQELNARDGYGISETGEVNIIAIDPSEILLMDVPMN